MFLRRSLPVLLAAMLVLYSAAARATEIGDPAPPLKIAQWVKGEPVDLAARKDKGATVIEFWATWCGPCKQSIPHLTEMQKQFKDKGVLFVGVSREKVDVVKPFVDQMADKMGYVVAVDDADATTEAFMKAFKVEGIPHAFVIGPKGEILWHGHPMAGLDKVLEQVVAGTFDVEAAKKEILVHAAMVRYFERVSQGLDDEETRKLGTQVLADAAKLAETENEFAWSILTEPTLKKRDLDLAMKAAQAALDASGGKDPAILDTYARALCDTGKLPEAIDAQKKAIELCTDEDLRKELEQTLRGYEEKATKPAVGPGGGN